MLLVNDVPVVGEAQVWYSKETEYVSPAKVWMACARVTEPESGLYTRRQYVLMPQFLSLLSVAPAKPVTFYHPGLMGTKVEDVKPDQKQSFTSRNRIIVYVRSSSLLTLMAFIYSSDSNKLIHHDLVVSMTSPNIAIPSFDRSKNFSSSAAS